MLKPQSLDVPNLCLTYMNAYVEAISPVMKYYNITSGRA